MKIKAAQNMLSLCRVTKYTPNKQMTRIAVVAYYRRPVLCGVIHRTTKGLVFRAKEPLDARFLSNVADYMEQFSARV